MPCSFLTFVLHIHAYKHCLTSPEGVPDHLLGILLSIVVSPCRRTEVAQDMLSRYLALAGKPVTTMVILMFSVPSTGSEMTL